MGIVVRQTFFSSISAYVGVIIGYVNIVLVMPLFLSEAEIGLVRTINSIAMLLVPLALIGASGTIVRFFPKMQDKLPKLLGLTLTLVVMAYVLVTVVSCLFKDFWFDFFKDKSPEVNDYFGLVYIMLGMMVIFNYLEAISRAGLNITVPNFFREIVYKSGHLLVVFAVGYGLLTYHQYLYSHMIIYIFLILGLGYYVAKNVTLKFSFRSIFSQPKAKEIINFSLFSILGSFGIMMVLQIDQIMVSSYLGLAQNGIYSTALYMAVAIELPRRLISQITTPIIAKAYHDERFSDINRDYKNVSNSLFFLGGLLFLLITLNLQNIYAIMPNGDSFAQGIWVVYLIGMTKIVDMVFSVNGEIIAMSKIYKYNVILILGLGILTVITNSIFIPKVGMEGAAIATLVTYLVFNIIKYIILKIKYGFDPFSLKTVSLLLLMATGYFMISLIPTIANAWIDLLLRSTIVGAYFILLFWWVNPSEELKIIIEKVLSKQNRNNS